MSAVRFDKSVMKTDKFECYCQNVLVALEFCGHFPEFLAGYD